MSDTPRAVTSSSNLKRRFLCPGSARMETGIPEQASEYSDEGTNLHEYYMRPEKDRSGLTEEQCNALDCADRETVRFLDAFAKQMGIPDGEPFVDYHEETLSYDGFAVQFPGHADFIRVWTRLQIAAISDAKFGYLEVDDASDNLQLVSYACMLEHGSIDGYANIGVAVVRPRNFGPKITSANYTNSALAAAMSEIETVVIDSEQPDAPLNPSPEACRYCKAKLICPALTGRALALVDPEPLTTKTAPDYLAVLDDDRLGYILDSIKLAAMLDKHAKAEATRRIEAGQMPDWQLKPGAEQKKIEDPLTAFALLSAVVPDLDDRTFMNACDLSRERLKKPVALLLKCPQTHAEKLILDTLEPVIVRTRNASSVVRK